jgi:hypothetical protein
LVNGTVSFFAGFTMFDFQRLRTHTDITAAPLLAVSIFLDVLNVFLFSLQIFSAEERQKRPSALLPFGTGVLGCTFRTIGSFAASTCRTALALFRQDISPTPRHCGAPCPIKYSKIVGATGFEPVASRS